MKSWFPNTWSIFKREFTGYFTTPVAYVFLVIYLVLQAAFTWGIGQLYESSQAHLYPRYPVFASQAQSYFRFQGGISQDLAKSNTLIFTNKRLSPFRQ